MKRQIFLVLTLSSLFFISTLSFAQDNYEQLRKNEREKVKEYFWQMHANSPRSNRLPESSKTELNNFPGKINAPAKTAFHERRKNYFMNGNRVLSEIYNYGGIAPGYDLLRGVNNGVWRSSSYIFQFCPIIAASVSDKDDPNKRLHIISDGLWDYPALREVDPADNTFLWTFQPLPGYSDSLSDVMASNPASDKDGDGKPDSWPYEWYNPTLGKYVWPGYLEQDATNADLEVFWGMDDRDNREFNYYPFSDDSLRKGLGVQIDGRALQWSNTLAENSIFFVYTITNVSEQDLDSVYFGIYGDCDVGGGSPENTDDNGLFVPPYNYDGNHPVEHIPPYARSMVYFFDPDGMGALQIPVGYVACKFLESPGNPNNGIDDDGDGMTDEAQDDGIDNDGDWNAATDDVGIDGIPNTGDEGEGDGIPTAGRKLPNGALDPLYPGEPNFEFTDLDEADQIGLTSFNSWTWNTDKVSNDESMWNRIKAGNFSEIIQNTDIVFIFGSGVISLKKGETKRISMSLLFGETLDDLLVSAETVQRIYNANYRFFKPPSKPNVFAVPGDKKVTLYWDSKAEESFDPLTGKDFEGYVIYRSTDPTFSDLQTITDGRGNAFFSTPLKNLKGEDARWDVDKRDEPYVDVNGNGKYDGGEPYTDINLNGHWDSKITDWWREYHPVSFGGRGIQYYMGNNTGLVHSFVDSNKVINGQTYYYAVVAYDHGDSTGIPPTETTKKITVDPITSTIDYDVNTVQVIPGPRASGYSSTNTSSFGLTQISGIGNGEVKIHMFNDLAVLDNVEYKLAFSDSTFNSIQKKAQKNYSVLKLKSVEDRVSFFDTNFSNLSYQDLDQSFNLTVSKSNVTYTENIDYVVDYMRGIIRRTGISSIPVNEFCDVTYRYYPVYQSTLLANEDGNPVFDGLKVFVNDQPKLAFDSLGSRWAEGNTNYNFKVAISTLGAKKALYPADYEIRFSSQIIDSARVLRGSQFTTVPVRYSVRLTPSNQRIWSLLKESPSNNQWDPGDEIILFTPTSNATTSDTATWGIIITIPDTSVVNPIAPTDGDILLIRSLRPYSKTDAFSFTAKAGTYSSDLTKSRLDDIYVVPNPYVGFNELEPVNKLPGKTRGERRIYFENLPLKCTIRIFTLSGEHVKTIEHESTFENGREFWNLLNEDGFSVAYGIYFAHIDAPGIGEKIHKFALIK